MQTSALGSEVLAPTLVASRTALPPRGAHFALERPGGETSPTLVASTVRRHARGFTLLELLVVVSIIGLGTAGVAFAMRDGAQSQLEQEAQRLSALLESARAQSRSSGVPVRWVGTAQGFIFEGLTQPPLLQRWLNASTVPQTTQRITLGPEPLIGKQAVTLTSTAARDRSITVSTDGLRPFKVLSADATGVMP